MSDTITDYFTFSPGTKARSSQVNTNFSNHRGDLVPINTDTATASDLSHDLGQADRRWVELYIDTVLFADQTTAGLGIRGNAGGNGIDVLVENTISAQFAATTGMAREGLGPRTIQVNSGSAQHFVRSDPASHSTAATSDIFSLEITPKGNIVHFGWIAAASKSRFAISVNSDTTVAYGSFNLKNNLGTTVSSFDFGFFLPGLVTATAGNPRAILMPPNPYMFTYSSITANTSQTLTVEWLPGTGESVRLSLTSIIWTCFVH